MSDTPTPPIERLADLYRRRDGTMRACNYYPDGRCLRTGCYRDGCDRANEILKTMQEAKHAG